MKDIKTVAAILALFLLGCVMYNAMGTKPATATTSHASATLSADQITGTPTLTAAFIDHVLATAASPAQGLGSTLYQLSLQYHIDDAFALAFFHHESDYGRYGMALPDRSLGNIRCTAGYQCDPSGGYRAYGSWAAGAQDWYQLIATVYIPQGLSTVSRIIPVYAPAGDHNDEAAYIASVQNDVRSYRQEEGQA